LKPERITKKKIKNVTVLKEKLSKKLFKDTLCSTNSYLHNFREANYFEGRVDNYE
jgi:hypothetical protein